MLFFFFFLLKMASTSYCSALRILYPATKWSICCFFFLGSFWVNDKIWSIRLSSGFIDKSRRAALSAAWESYQTRWHLTGCEVCSWQRWPKKKKKRIKKKKIRCPKISKNECDCTNNLGLKDDNEMKWKGGGTRNQHVFSFWSVFNQRKGT